MRPLKCHCQTDLARLNWLVRLLADANGLDLDELIAADSAPVRFGTPSTWAECLAAGVDPVTGEEVSDER